MSSLRRWPLFRSFLIRPINHGSMGHCWLGSFGNRLKPLSSNRSRRRWRTKAWVEWRVSRSVSVILKYPQKWNDIIYRYSRLWIDVTAVQEPDIHAWKKDLGRAFLYTLHLFLNTVHRLSDGYARLQISRDGGFVVFHTKLCSNKLQVIGVNEISRRRSTNTQMDLSLKFPLVAVGSSKTRWFNSFCNIDRFLELLKTWSDYSTTRCVNGGSLQFPLQEGLLHLLAVNGFREEVGSLGSTNIHSLQLCIQWACNESSEIQMLGRKHSFMSMLISWSVAVWRTWRRPSGSPVSRWSSWEDFGGFFCFGSWIHTDVKKRDHLAWSLWNLKEFCCKNRQLD